MNADPKNMRSSALCQPSNSCSSEFDECLAEERCKLQSTTIKFLNSPLLSVSAYQESAFCEFIQKKGLLSFTFLLLALLYEV
jgi:hypothetical protein